jgi:asparagine synthase (glutamine-hydrolysing)
VGAIVAAYCKKGGNTTSLVQTMLKKIQHRETRKIIILKPKGARAPRALIATDSSETVSRENYTWAFEGQLFPSSTKSALKQMITQLGRQPRRIAGRILKELEGSYTFAIGFSDKVFVGRDTVGTSPLFYGENNLLCATATERKALWNAGIQNAHSFPPGNLATMNKTGFAFEPVSVLGQPSEKKIKMQPAAKRLKKLLEASTRDQISDVDKVAVAFSGGLDSGIIALLAKENNVSVSLISVGLEGQRENENAKRAAELLDLQLTLETFTVADVESVLPKVLWLIEEPDVMKASVGVSFYFTAQIASKLRHDVLLAGQGADELFGGYQRYLTDYAKGGTQQVRQALYHDTVMSYETNFQRDEPICAYHQVKLRLPFADTRVVRFALGLPINLKIESADDNLRKKVLRQVAKMCRLPASITNKPKKAIQFATGVDKTLRGLAKKEGLTPRAYVEEVFRQVLPARGR